MDMDEDRELKRVKVEEVEEVESLELEVVLKQYIEAQQQLVKLLLVIGQKVVGFEKVFSKDLFKQ